MPQILLNETRADILILTESGNDIGLGHVTRCMAIASALEQFRLKVVLIINDTEGTFSDLVKHDYVLLDWIHDLQHLDISRYKFVLMDSYLAGSRCKNRVFEQANHLAFYDDGFCLDFPGGYVFNGLIYASKLNYINNDIKYFFGTKFLPVRTEFNIAVSFNVQPDIKNIFICTGSQDTNNIVGVFLNLIGKQFSNVVVNIVGKTAFINGNDTNLQVNQYNNLSAEEVKILMLEADIAIGNGGQISTELGKLGIPSILYCAIKNQSMNVSCLVDRGCALSGGSYLESEQEIIEVFQNSLKQIKNYNIRQNLSDSIRSCYRYDGAKRIAAVIDKMCKDG